MATGIVSNPHVPEIPGRERFGGRIIHSVEYRRPDAFKGQRVLVVGVGNSAGEISVELADAGAHVTVAIRSGARVVPRQLLGIPIQYFAVALSPLPRSTFRRVTTLTGKIAGLARGPAVLPQPIDTICSNIPLIGFHLADAVRSGRIRLNGGVAEFTPAAVRFSDGSQEEFDHVILATGYRAAVGMLGDLVRLDDCGFAARRGRVVSLDQPGLYFVGHNYDPRGGLRNIAQDAKIVARLISARPSGATASP
jgi:cation diffusion facilitator CzcD-associated flavoprotein CzcO